MRSSFFCNTQQAQASEQQAIATGDVLGLLHTETPGFHNIAIIFCLNNSIPQNTKDPSCPFNSISTKHISSSAQRFLNLRPSDFARIEELEVMVSCFSFDTSYIYPSTPLSSLLPAVSQPSAKAAPKKPAAKKDTRRQSDLDEEEDEDDAGLAANHKQQRRSHPRAIPGANALAQSSLGCLEGNEHAAPGVLCYCLPRSKD